MRHWYKRVVMHIILSQFIKSSFAYLQNNFPSEFWLRTDVITCVAGIVCDVYSMCVCWGQSGGMAHSPVYNSPRQRLCWHKQWAAPHTIHPPTVPLIDSGSPRWQWKKHISKHHEICQNQTLWLFLCWPCKMADACSLDSGSVFLFG